MLSLGILSVTYLAGKFEVCTYAAIIACEPIFFKNDLIAIRLQNRQCIRMFSKDQASLSRIALHRRIIVKELAIPNLLLRLPVHHKALLHRPAKRNLSIVATLFELRPDVDFSRAISGDAVGDYARLVDVAVANEAGFDRVCAIVEDEGVFRRFGACGFRFPSSGHGGIGGDVDGRRGVET